MFLALPCLLNQPRLGWYRLPTKSLSAHLFPWLLSLVAKSSAADSRWLLDPPVCRGTLSAGGPVAFSLLTLFLYSNLLPVSICSSS